MGEWTPVVIGYGFLVLLFIAAALSPRAWWVQELARRYGVQPSGPFGIFTRRDLGRRAALSTLACIGCLAASMAAFEVMERIPEYKRLNLVAGTYFFGFSLLAGVGLLSAIIALWQAIFYRPRRPPVPFDPTAWTTLADLLDRFADGPVPDPEWAPVLARTSHDPALEQVRQACLRLCGGRPQRFSGPLQQPARAWAAELRALAI